MSGRWKKLGRVSSLAVACMLFLSMAQTCTFHGDTRPSESVEGSGNEAGTRSVGDRDVITNSANSWTVQTGVSGDAKIWNNGIRGEGQIIGMGDNGLAYDHECFRNSTTALDNQPGPWHRKVVGYHAIPPIGDNTEASMVHGTPNAGMAAGDNTVIIGPNTGNANGRGLAYKSRISLCDVSAGTTINTPGDMTLLYQPAYDDGARVFTLGLVSHLPVQLYIEPCRTSDLFAWDHPDMLIMCASGSAADAYVAAPGTAKNVLSIGAGNNGAGAENVCIFTSYGPTTDGRIKPDIILPGDGPTYLAGITTSSSDLVWMNFENPSLYIDEIGTGEASAVASGAASLVRQYFTDGYYPSGAATPSDAVSPSSALLKAMLVNAAQEMTGTGANDHPYNGMNYPNCDQGWGRVILDNALYFPGDAAELRVHDNDVGLQEGYSKEYTLAVDDNSVPLEITLAWNDYASPSANPSLINNLDLQVTDITGGDIVYKGNVFAGAVGSGQSTTGGSADSTNIAENVLRLIPTIGTYKINVTATSIGVGLKQPYALVVTGGIGSLEYPPDVVNAYADPNPTNGAGATTLHASLIDSDDIVGVEYFIDSAGVGGTGVAMAPADGGFDSPSESATAAVNVASLGWLPGETHRLYVHGLDETGKWGAFCEVVVYVGEGYYLHVEIATGTTMSLLTTAPDNPTVATTPTGDLDVPGQFKVGASSGLTPAYATATEVGGTWRYTMRGYETSLKAKGHLYAKVYTYDTMSLLNPAPAQCPTDIYGRTSYDSFEWSETIPATVIAAGDRILLEVWLDVTEASGGVQDVVCDFVDVTQASGPHDAYLCIVDSNAQGELTTPNSMPELTDQEYVNVSASDNIRAVSAYPPNQDEIWVRYRFQLSEPGIPVTGISMRHEAMYSAGVTATLYAYNYITAQWTQVGATEAFSANVEKSMVRAITANVGEYVSTAGGINWGVYASARATCSLDYANTTVTCDAPYTQFVLGFDNAAAPSMVVVPEKPATGGEWFNITVALGWNLISVPIATANVVLPGALTDKAGTTVQWSRAMWYDPAGGADKWKQYNTAWAAGMNDLPVVDLTKGVWLYVPAGGLGDGQICVGGAGYSKPVSTSITLRANSWNLVGFPSDDTTYTVAMLKAAYTSVTNVEKFTGVAPYYQGPMGDGEAFVPGSAYWIYNSGGETTWDKTW